MGADETRVEGAEGMTLEQLFQAYAPGANASRLDGRHGGVDAAQTAAANDTAVVATPRSCSPATSR